MSMQAKLDTLAARRAASEQDHNVHTTPLRRPTVLSSLGMAYLFSSRPAPFHE